MAAKEEEAFRRPPPPRMLERHASAIYTFGGRSRQNSKMSVRGQRGSIAPMGGLGGFGGTSNSTAKEIKLRQIEETLIEGISAMDKRMKKVEELLEKVLSQHSKDCE